jgi:hypothetical protein
MDAWWDALTFWNLMAALGALVFAVMVAAAAYGMVQGLADGWRESFPEGFRWPWDPVPGEGNRPRIYRVDGREESGPDG